MTNARLVRGPLAIVALALALVSFYGCAREPVPARIAPGQGHVNAQAITLIKRNEDLRLEAYQYAGQWLIGYGHAGDVTPGQKITAKHAERLLREDLRNCEAAIARNVRVPVTINEYSAMAALCYNIGISNFANSSVVERLNSKDRKGAADAFRMWTKATIDGEKRDLTHLRARREDERALFLQA